MLTGRRSLVVGLMAAVAVVVLQLDGGVGGVMGNVVFRVDNKFKIAGKNRTMSEMRAHDFERHRRILSAVDINLGGNAHPSASQLYFAKIGLGTPARKFYVQVDTGSDLLWVNCAGCDSCPKKSELGVKLSLFDPAKSNTSKLVDCDHPLCIEQNNYKTAPRCKKGVHCPYRVGYGDNSATTGYLVNDYVHLSQVTGDLQTETWNSSIIFGCGDKQFGTLNSTFAQTAVVDGLVGFGAANTSIISQLAAAGKVKKQFSHCFDMEDGGGIFAIGEVVWPQINTTTPLLPDTDHYNVELKRIDVNGETLQVPAGIFDYGEDKGTIVDSGTTMAYLPEEAYKPLMAKIESQQTGGVKFETEGFDVCFKYTENIDDKFPPVTFHFENSLTMMVYPHEYLFLTEDGDHYCFGFMNAASNATSAKGMGILGDVVLQNRLVVYDIENMTVGWVEFDCKSTSIKLRDEKSGTEYSIGAHDVSPAMSLIVDGRIFSGLLMLVIMLHRLIVQ